MLRAEIVRLAAEGKANGEIARRLDSSLPTVSLWRRCLSEERLAAFAIDRDSAVHGVFPWSR